MKRIFATVIALVALYLAVFSTYSYGKAKENYEGLKSELKSFASVKTEAETAKTMYARAQKNFENSRSSELYFGDIERILTVLNSTIAINVVGCEPCKAENYFSETSGSTDSASAVKLSVTTDNITTALNILNVLELPIYSIEVTEPNMIDVVFLTGNPLT